jgi:hypothetical protein
VCAPLSTDAVPASRCSLCPFLLYCYTAFYPAPSQSSLALLVIVGLVGVKLVGTLPWSATGTLDRLYGVDELFENHRVVDVCRANHHTERDAPPVRNTMALRARFSFIRRILADFVAPLLAGMEAESKQARSHSIWSASPRRSKSTRCSRSQTPASCHSRKRRQHVTPEPQPFSWGNISQGMPLFSTKMMPLRAARSSTRGLPPCGLGASVGRFGW